MWLAFQSGSANRTLRLNLYAYKFYYSMSLFNVGVTFLKITVYSDIM